MTDIILPEKVQSFMKVFKEKKYQIFVVGGAVRNMLLNTDTDNWDFTTNATPEEIMSLFPHHFYNNTYGTVSVVDTPFIFEVTPFREEGKYTDSRHPGELKWADSIEKDIKRRDFTINALAYDGENLIDLFNGIADLNAKIVKAVGEPDIRFQEDALRLMRAVRIATFMQFAIEEHTFNSIRNNASLLQNISRERIRDELFKILQSEYPADGIMLLKDTGLLKFIIPELEKAFEIPQKSPKRHHIYDVGTHCVLSLKFCLSKDPIVRLATLLHDIGKPATFKKDPETEIITFYNHEIVGADIALQIADRLRLSKEQKNKLFTLVRYHQFTVSELQTDKAVKRFIREIGKENIEDMLTLREADRIGSGSKPTSWRTELFKKRLIDVQKEPFKVTDLKINGKDVMELLNIPPGPKVGEILEDIFKEVEEKQIENKREVLLKKISLYK